MHDAWPRLRGRRIRSFRRRLDQRLDVLMTEPRDPLTGHVTTDHAVRQTRLKRLVDDASAPAEIALAAGHEGGERQLFGDAAAQCMQHTCLVGFAVDEFDFPYALAVIATVLLQHPRAGLQPCRKRVTKFAGAAVQMRVRAPAQML